MPGRFSGGNLTARVDQCFLNPGWDQSAQPLEQFTDVRELQQQLKAQGLILGSEADPDSSGPASIMLEDPYGNPVLIDQHR